MWAEAGRLLPETTPFLYGHSMGALVAIRWLQTRQVWLPGVVLSAPWLATAMDVPSWKLFLASMLLRVAPGLTISSGPPRPEFLTRDLLREGEYLADPLVHRRISPRFHAEVRRAQAAALQEGLPGSCRRSWWYHRGMISWWTLRRPSVGFGSRCWAPTLAFGQGGATNSTTTSIARKRRVRYAIGWTSVVASNQRERTGYPLAGLIGTPDRLRMWRRMKKEHQEGGEPSLSTKGLEADPAPTEDPGLAELQGGAVAKDDLSGSSISSSLNSTDSMIAISG